MKKLVMYLAGTMMAISLAACTPTQVTETAPNTVGRTNPQGITPEMVKESDAEISTEKLGDPNAPVYEMAFIYSVNAEGTKLVRQVEDVEVLSEEVLGERLIEKGVMDEGVDVISLSIEGGEVAGPGVEAGSTEGGERIGTLELSQAPTANTDKEQLVLNAIANTFIENFELDKLQILVNEEVYTSADMTDGYLIYTDDYDEEEGEYLIDIDDSGEKENGEEEEKENEEE